MAADEAQFSQDKRLMARAIAVARPQQGRTAPNPAVGCVIAQGETILSEAATGDGGRPHAEEAALAQAGEGARGATAYVTLEPCGLRSTGAPSCGQRLAAAGVARVVVACHDPHENADGAGLSQLAEAGVPVVIGVLEGEARALHRGFLHRVATGRPLVVIDTETAGYEGDVGALLEQAGWGDGLQRGRWPAAADWPALLDAWAAMGLSTLRLAPEHPATSTLLQSGLAVAVQTPDP